MSSAGSSADASLVTFPGILLRNARQWADRPAIREKEYGIWQSWTWSEVLEEVRPYSLGLKQLGLVSGDRIAIVGANRPRLYWTIAAAQAIGCIPVPVYADAVAEEMSYVLEHAEAKIVVCENQEQVDKVLEISENLPGLQHIVYDDKRGLRDYDHTKLHSFEVVQQAGLTALANDTALEKSWLDGIARGKRTDTAVMLYTSGTTGRPKGVILSFENTVVSALNACKFDNLTEKDEVLAYLPMAWVGDHIFSYCQSYVAGFCISCPENAETMMHDMREIGPTFLFAPPSIFERVLTTVMIRMEDADRITQKLFHYYIRLAKEVGEKILNGEKVPLLKRLAYMLGDFAIYGPLKNVLGMSKVRVGYTAGEAIGPEIFSFYRSLGINLKQLYGQTEASIYVTVQPDGEIKPDTVGIPAPEVEIKISDDGEVLFRGPGVFQSYFKNEKATKETKTEDGWVLSGDAGFFDDTGHLKIIDRAKDVGKLNDGSLFAPKYIENKLKFFPNIKEVVTFGRDREECTCFINIDLVAVGNWAERHNIAYASYQELAAHAQVYDMIRSHIEEVNESLSSESLMSGSQIAKFLILHKELDADDGELTRTLKVRRRFIAERYDDLIEALYDGSEDIHTTTQVTFEDGRTGSIKGHLKIMNAKRFAAVERKSEAAE
ncbi:MAG: AMP-binding protein [Cohaesibacteraceae bacterium]|nr:AMP-binding protein [Cohaesibacteraceae bacterium]